MDMDTEIRDNKRKRSQDHPEGKDLERDPRDSNVQGRSRRRGKTFSQVSITGTNTPPETDVGDTPKMPQLHPPSPSLSTAATRLTSTNAEVHPQPRLDTQTASLSPTLGSGLPLLMETLPLPLSFGTPPSPGSFDTPPSPATPPSSTSSGSVYKRELELELEPLPFELKLKSLSEGLEDVYLFRVESEVRVPSRSADRDVDGEVEMGDGGGEDGDEVGNMVVDGENEEDEETTPRLGSGRGRENGRMMRTTKLPYVDEDDVISLVFRRD